MASLPQTIAHIPLLNICELYRMKRNLRSFIVLIHRYSFGEITSSISFGQYFFMVVGSKLFHEIIDSD